MENRKANLALVELIKDVASKKNATPAQVALAWILARKPWIVPIPGTTKPERLMENLGVFNVELSPEELKDIGTAAEKIQIQGERYAESSARWIDR
jgi:aryl-alcohol dehydrogenase-like predicted oxidoreductase